MTKAPDLIPFTAAEAAWINSHPELASSCQWLVRYACAFNSLDISPLKGTLSPWVSYESQSVFEKMTGPKALYAYWEGKFASIARSDSKVVAELCTLPRGKPGVTLFQATSSLDTNWLDKPLAVMTAEVNQLGEATNLLMITCTPSPGTARGSRVFPGLTEIPLTNEKKFIRKSSDYSEIKLYAFYLSGKTSFDSDMACSVNFAKESLPGLEVIEETIAGPDSSAERKTANNFLFVGFPSVGAKFNGKTIYRHQGLIDGHNLVEALKAASPLYLTARSPLPWDTKPG